MGVAGEWSVGGEKVELHGEWLVGGRWWVVGGWVSASRGWRGGGGWVLDRRVIGRAGGRGWGCACTRGVCRCGRTQGKLPCGGSACEVLLRSVRASLLQFWSMVLRFSNMVDFAPLRAATIGTYLHMCPAQWVIPRW